LLAAQVDPDAHLFMGLATRPLVAFLSTLVLQDALVRVLLVLLVLSVPSQSWCCKVAEAVMIF